MNFAQVFKSKLWTVDSPQQLQKIDKMVDKSPGLLAAQLRQLYEV
jgi:hypothetical protein